MQRYILDTNLFFNMEARLGLGETSLQIINNLSKALQKDELIKNISICMPPGIRDEIRSFFIRPEDMSVVDQLFSLVTIKSPDLNKLDTSASSVALFIDEVRERTYRGMRICEEEIEKTGQTFMGHEVLPKKEFQITVGQNIKNFRDRYRNATRTGIIDSRVDFELIMLARELDAHLISTDEGVIYWSRHFGVREMEPSLFGKMILKYL